MHQTENCDRALCLQLFHYLTCIGLPRRMPSTLHYNQFVVLTAEACSRAV